MLSPPQKKNGVILHPYLPITATSLQRPLTYVPKVAVVEGGSTVYTNRSLIYLFIILQMNFIKKDDTFTIRITVGYLLWKLSVFLSDRAYSADITLTGR